MGSINHQAFRKKFCEIIGGNFDLVSTIDHPYTSPPIRLVDGHNNLKKLRAQGIRPLICIWDVNFPEADKYRYELALDLGILSSRDSNFFIFSDKSLYPLQRPRLMDFKEAKRQLSEVLKALQDLPKQSKTMRDNDILENFSRLEKIYIKNIKESDNGSNFYKNLMRDLYILMGLPDLSDFFFQASECYFNSPISKEWIPLCIQETKNEPFGLSKLIDAGIFKKPHFRTIDTREEGILFTNKDADFIISQIKSGALIPSYQIFFWTLFLANIKHFGNDYGFFNKLNEVITRKGISFPDNIQVTHHNQDSRNIIQFDNGRSFSSYKKNGAYVVRKNNPTKVSQTSSIPAIYCHLGSHLSRVVTNILEGKVVAPKIIKMGGLNNEI